MEMRYICYNLQSYSSVYSLHLQFLRFTATSGKALEYCGLELRKVLSPTLYLLLSRWTIRVVRGFAYTES